MTAPTAFLWAAAGHPAPDGPAAKLITDQPATCVMCGERHDRTAPAGKALGNNFTDHYLFRRPDSDRICTGCIWVTSGRPPASLRMWSIVAAPGVQLPPSQPKAWLQVPGLHLTNRADPTGIISVLTNPPDGDWLVSIAVSAQKHVAPFARVNHGPGRWTVRMEGTDVTATPDEWRTVLAAAATLRAAGHSGDQVLTLAPNLSKLRTRGDLDWWTTHAAHLTPWRESPLLNLALWCLTKETIHVHAHPRPDEPAGPDRRDDDPPGCATQLSFC